MRVHRAYLFEQWVSARTHAQQSDCLADHQAAINAYTALMRAHLASDERTHLDLEDEIARLRAENTNLRAQVLGSEAPDE